MPLGAPPFLESCLRDNVMPFVTLRHTVFEIVELLERVYRFRDNHREIVFREAKILTSFPFGVWHLEAPRLRLQSI